MKTHNKRNLCRILVLLALPSLLGGCIMTPRVEMTERIDFNYRPPAISAPLSPVDQLCHA